MAKTQKQELAVIDFTQFSVAQLPELKGKIDFLIQILKDMSENGSETISINFVLNKLKSIGEIEVVAEEVVEFPALDKIEEFANKDAQEVEFEETLYQGTYKNLSETVASFELVFAINDLPKFEHLKIKELLEPYNVPTLKQ